MLVCIDKITCARMLQRIEPRWQAKLAAGSGAASRSKEAELAAATDPDVRERLARRHRIAARPGAVDGRARSSRSSSARRRTRSRDFKKWGFDIIPHRAVMKTGLRDARRQAGDCRGRLQGPAASVPRRHRLRDVADRLRRGVPVDALHRQADEGAHADAGHRPRQPRLSGQGLRRHRRLQRHAEEPARGAGAVRPRRRRGRRRRRRSSRRSRSCVPALLAGHRGDGDAPARARASIRPG